MSARCISPGCGRFVRFDDLWCRECHNADYDCWENRNPPECQRIHGECCMTVGRLEDLGIDPFSETPWREQYDALASRLTAKETNT